jgi:predicted HAD superfamily Cof-like phosphohydrolase
VTSFQAQVKEFHELCGFHVGEFGEVPPLEVRRSRAALVMEEARELALELLADDPQWAYDQLQLLNPKRAVDPYPVDMVKVAHETADVHYVASGASVNGGWDEAAVFAKIHRSNMLKAYLADRAVGDEHGKARKPADWTPPDVSTVMRPYDEDTTNAEEAARWLARESRHPLYDGEGWRLLLQDPSKVDHASRHAAGRVTAGTSTQDIHDASELLREHIRGRR